ncbi:DNA translocase FtsK, partial [Methylicorpusculum sp.]|uniref:DNA translocase FtsK n=1 Tax=Methylicorpusculum sp. TaxID=2713644 RepID=UPI002ABB31BF
HAKRSVRIPFARELRLLAYSVTLLFAALAVITFHAQDSSWFYASTDPVVLHNKGGAVGAALAVIFFYFFGVASFVIIGMLFFMVYLLFMQRTWRSEWERIGAGFLLVCVVAALGDKYAFDFWGSGYTGGIVGRGALGLLNSFFDPLVATFFLYTLLFVCCVLLLRISWIVVLRAVGRGMRWVLRKAVSKERVWAPAYRVSKKIAHGASYPLVYAVRLAKKVCDGSLVTDAEYTVFDFESVLDGEVGDFWAYEQGSLRDVQSDKQQESFATMPHVAAAVNAPVMGMSESAGQLRIDTASAGIDEKPVSAGGVGPQGLAACQSGIQEGAGIVSGQSCVGGAGVVSDVGLKVGTVSAQGSEGAERLKAYRLPSLEIFIGVAKERQDKQVRQELEERARLLEEKLERFGVLGKVTAIKYGPVVTLFEYQPEIDTKLSKILALEDDLSLALQAMSIRILAPIPGRAVVGFEVANQRRLDVALSALIRSKQYQAHTGVLPLILGEDTIGEFVVVDLSKMPHLLIAGSTGSGKSVALNVMLVSLLCRLSPDDLRLVLIDPKRLEFASYADIAHLLFPVITDATQATIALRWVVQEMERRYEKMAACGVRTIADYRATQKADLLPYIVVVIDELADLMMTAGRDCQDLITRITQMARAAGIHLIVATQRPSVDVITGLIKANFPSRISFRVASKIDSRTILDCGGADKLLGRGDMLYLDAASCALRRVHGAYVSDKEIAGVIAHIRAERPAQCRDLLAEVGGDDPESLSAADDTLYRDVRAFLASIDEVSISLLQRKFRIGYNRSARIIDMLESQGLVLPADGGKTRKVIR